MQHGHVSRVFQSLKVTRGKGQLAVVVYDSREEEAYRDWLREDGIRNNVPTFIHFGLDFVRSSLPDNPSGKGSGSSGRRV